MPRLKEETTSFLRQCFVTATVCINLVGNGCLYGFPGIMLPQLHDPGSTISLSKDQESWIASTISITLLVGDLMMSLIMGKMGRKIGHFAVVGSSIAGWIILIFANSFEVLMLTRIVHGLSFGFIVPLRSVIIGEYTSPKNRGAFLTTMSLCQAFGVFFVHTIGSLLSWRNTAVICLFFASLSLVLTCYIPESPSWLADKGKYEECRKSFHWLRGNSEEEELEELIEARIEVNDLKRTTRRTFRIEHMLSTAKKPEFYKPIVLMSHVASSLTLAGNVNMAIYPMKLLSLIMGPNVEINVWMVVIDTQRLFVNAAAIYIINRTKRRTMVWMTSSLCIASHVAIAGYVYARIHGMLTYDAVWISAVLVNIQFFTVGVGMVPLPSVIAGEVFPLQYRSIGGSISTGVGAGFMFLVLKTFPALVDCMGIHGTYVLYAAILTYILVVTLSLLPETKGRTLQQIEDTYKGVKRKSRSEVDIEMKQRLREKE